MPSELKYGSFAEAMTVLGNLTKIEGAVQIAIKNSRIPPKETRKLLKCSTSDEAMNTPIFQYLKELFKQIGLGNIELGDAEIFRFSFVVDHCPICKLYPGVKGKVTCYVTADTLAQFFTKDMGIPSTAEEVKCTNHGDKACEFSVSLQPLSVYQMALDATDKKIISTLIEKKETTSIADAFNLSPEELAYRMDVLRRYHILDDNRAPTEIGDTYCKYVQNFPVEDDDFQPPWHNMSKVSGAISASMSFAEAFSETAEEDAQHDLREKDVVNLAEKAKNSKSFAELVSKNILSTDDSGGK
ncbi:MAG: hypothetical protein HZB92_03855 [Euryarchaeota archaeon]|nr:hypothetical protein [Euryarchaeota archaeon]